MEIYFENIEKVDPDSLKKWLEEGHHPDNGVEFKENSPLCDAVLFGRNDLAEFLIRYGADPNFYGTHGRTPLMNAGKTGSIEMARLLITAGAFVNLTDDDGRTALAFAVFNDQVELSEFLLSKGADPNGMWDVEQGTTLLMIAADRDAVPMIRVLLQSNADTFVTDKRDLTAYLHALLNGKHNAGVLLDGSPEIWENWKINHRAAPDSCCICSGMHDHESIDYTYPPKEIPDIRPFFFKMMDCIEEGVWKEEGYLQLSKTDLFRCPCCQSLFRRSIFSDQETHCNQFRVECVRIGNISEM